ncbi:hypothetical protein Emed_000086 [Eimeria media]
MARPVASFFEDHRTHEISVCDKGHVAVTAAQQQRYESGWCYARLVGGDVPRKLQAFMGLAAMGLQRIYMSHSSPCDQLIVTWRMSELRCKGYNGAIRL